MRVVDFIAAKRDGIQHTEEQIRAFITGVAKGEVPDYQTSAWLMAVFLKGMTFPETLALTRAMRDSGERIVLPSLSTTPSLDKHSTGGVGDKTSLVVVPLLAAAGIPILKMSGRGLGFSGGTIDKLESIPGLRVALSVHEAEDQVRRIGIAILSQSAELAPADGKLYALRDVTATIESVPLIASSIMSKKLAGGAQRILLDVKVGSGSFMPTTEQALELAQILVAIGKAEGVPTSAILTDMEEPLGRMVGNALEVREAIEILLENENGEPRFLELCLGLTAHGLQCCGKVDSLEEAVQMAHSLLERGAGAEKLAAMIQSQGGPSSLAEVLQKMPKAAYKYVVRAPQTGYIAAIKARVVGELALRLGAGRSVKEEQIDHSVGIELLHKRGAYVKAGEAVAMLHLRMDQQVNAATYGAALLSAYAFSSEPPVFPQTPLLQALT